MHLIRYFGLLTAFVFATQIAFAQTERTVYQVVELETNIQVTHAPPSIVDYLIKEGRYEVSSDTLIAGEIKIYTKNRDRKPFKTPSGACTELAKARILIPDTYEWTEKNKILRRKPEEEMYKQWKGGKQ
jgi:hypothetical protein